jgi:hypothetical protein
MGFQHASESPRSGRPACFRPQPPQGGGAAQQAGQQGFQKRSTPGAKPKGPGVRSEPGTMPLRTFTCVLIESRLCNVGVLHGAAPPLHGRAAIHQLQCLILVPQEPLAFEALLGRDGHGEVGTLGGTERRARQRRHLCTNALPAGRTKWRRSTPALARHGRMCPDVGASPCFARRSKRMQGATTPRKGVPPLHTA